MLTTMEPTTPAADYARVYANAVNMTYAEIDALAPMLNALTVAELCNLGVQVDHLRTKAKIVASLVQRVKERKGSWERINWR